MKTIKTSGGKTNVLVTNWFHSQLNVSCVLSSLQQCIITLLFDEVVHNSQNNVGLGKHYLALDYTGCHQKPHPTVA